MYYKVLDTIKVLAIVFAVWILYDTSGYVKVKSDQALKLTADTKDQTLKEVQTLRTDTFKFLDTTVVQLDNRLSSIQTGTFKRVDKASEGLLLRVDRMNDDLNSQLTDTNKTVALVAKSYSDLAKEYSTIPSEIKAVATRFDEQTDCEVNPDLCWQNLASDLLIDTRNVMRDGSKTFREVNASIPQFVDDSTQVSAAVAKNLPVIADNIAKTSDHIQKITKPKWYDKILSYGISGGLLYFTAKRP